MTPKENGFELYIYILEYIMISDIHWTVNCILLSSVDVSPQRLLAIGGISIRSIPQNSTSLEKPVIFGKIHSTAGKSALLACSTCCSHCQYLSCGDYITTNVGESTCVTKPVVLASIEKWQTLLVAYSSRLETIADRHWRKRKNGNGKIEYLLVTL